MKKYARILDYLQNHEKEIFGLFDELGMQGTLTPFRGRGITLLLPDAKTVKKLQGIVVSEAPEEATDFLDTMILTDYYGSAQDFLKAKANIANRAGNTLLVKAVNGSKVVAEGEEGDVEITQVEKFKGFDRMGKAPREKMAVWQLKGMPKLKTPPAAPKKPLGGKVSGAAEPSQQVELAASKLSAWRQELVAKKLKCLAEGKHSEQDGKLECPLLSAVCQVLSAWREQAKESLPARACLYKARCLVTHNPCIDFFLLFANPQVFPAEQLIFAKEASAEVGAPASFLKDFCDKDVPEKEELELYKDLGLPEERALALHRAGMEQLREAREELVSNIAGNLTTALARTRSAYEQLAKQNQLGGARPALSPVLVRCYQEHPGLALLIDEAVWWLDTQLRACQALPLPEQAAFCAGMFRSWDEVYGDLTFEERKSLLLQPKRFGLELDGRGFAQECLAPFIKAYMLRVPCSTGLVSGGDDDEEGGDEDPYSPAPVDIGGLFRGGLEHYTNAEARVSKETILQMRAYMQAHGGQLPPELR